MASHRIALLSACVVVAACGSAPVLTVDVKTDYLPGTEFARVQTEVAGAAFTSPTAMGMVVPDAVHAGASYVDGVRIAELAGLVPGDRWVRVSLLRADGGIVAQRTVEVHVEGSYALTVILSHSCGGVTCPATGGDAALTACNGGRCVDPRCTPDMPSYCGTAECRTAGDCGGHGECGQPSCASGVCLVAPSDALCGGGMTCTADLHCVAGADAGPTDAGATDLGTTDLGAGCAGGCDDGNACTDDACASGTCRHTNNSSGCDDGDACTSGDHCSGGACGGSGYSCAGMAPPCMTASCDGSGGCSIGGGCGGGTTCSGGSCVACGGADQPCCGGSGCNTGLWCYTGVCTCAQPGGPCCPWDGSCAGGSVCMGGMCCMPGGASCGGGCCPGFSCLSGYCL